MFGVVPDHKHPQMKSFRKLGYFKRRKILKNANFLDLRPLQLHAYETHEDGTVTLLIPKFSGWLSGRVLQPFVRHPYISLALDEHGSATWLLCDGKLTVKAICKRLRDGFGQQVEPAEDRVTTFLSHMYKDNIITFREVTIPE